MQRGDGVLEGANGHDAQLAGMAAGVALLLRGDQEGDRPGPAGGGGLLGHAADRADLAVDVDGAGDRHLPAAGEVAGGEVVEQGQGEGQTGRRAGYLAGVDGHLDREVVAQVLRLEGHADPGDAVAVVDGLDRHGLGLAVPVHREGDDVARFVALDGADRLLAEDDR